MVPSDKPELALFPLVATMEALERWQREPSDESRGAVSAALEGILHVAGARGAVLEISAPPLPRLVVGAGSLLDPPAEDARAALSMYPLGSHGGHERLGRLFLDPPAEDARAALSMHPLGSHGGHERLGRLFLDPPAEDARAALSMYPLGSHGGHERLGRLFLDAPEQYADVVVRTIELAVDAAWSRAEVHGRAERLAALEAATRALAAELDIDRVLQLIVDRVRELIGARYAALGIADPRGRIERFITSGITPEARAAIGAVPKGHGLLGLIIREAQTVRTTDIATHPESVGFPANHPVMHSFLGAPVLVKGRSAGNLYLTEKLHDPFTEDDERLVEMFAVHAGIAIENARLHDQVQRLAVVEERERIGKDLHDGIIQAIYAVGLSLEDVPELVEEDASRVEAVARVDRAIDALNLVISDIRSYILRLRPAMGGEEDPVEALARLTEELGMNAVIDLEVDLDGGASALRGLVPDRRSDILFIAREALSNVARHSGATRTALVLGEDDGRLVLCIEDNGRGFEPQDLAGPDALGRHQGIGNMRDRAIAMGGTFAVERPDGPGTRIIVRVPTTSTAAPVGAVPPPPEMTDRD